MIATFYIYANSTNLDEIAPALRSRIESFIAAYGDRVRVADQRHRELPAGVVNGDLGVYFESAALADTEKGDLLLFFLNLSIEFSRDFVVSGASPHNQYEDFACVSAGESLEPAFDLLHANETTG